MNICLDECFSELKDKWSKIQVFQQEKISEKIQCCILLLLILELDGVKCSVKKCYQRLEKESFNLFFYALQDSFLIEFGYIH